MKHLRIFVWNDDESTARKWRGVIAGGDAPEDLNRVLISSAIDPKEVVRRIETEAPDVVLLDIKCSGDTKMGLKIAAQIREKDVLIPILAVTLEPRVVYMATDQFETLGFAGVFDASVMEDGIFEVIALRPSLNQWHLVAPEFALVRACIQQLRLVFQEVEKRFVDELCAMLSALPFSGSTESWHSQIRAPLVRLMNQRELTKLAKRFEALTRLFEQADPFYMAGSRSRRHLSHNVQVFLVGLFALLGTIPFRRTVVLRVQEVRPDASETEALMDAILVWACIANTHDTAYLSEHLSELTGRLQELTQEFAKAFPAGSQVKPLARLNWPSDAHSDIAARLWRQSLPQDQGAWQCADHYVEIIAAAIARHDSKHFPNSPVDSLRWAQFLAVLADELQDWGRERLSNPPGPKPYETVTWGLFCLEGIQLHHEGACIELTFIARDHPKIIADRFGRDGEETVRVAFTRIAQQLRENLQSPLGLEIRLTVHFVSRPAALPIYESIRIRRQE